MITLNILTIIVTFLLFTFGHICEIIPLSYTSFYFLLSQVRFSVTIHSTLYMYNFSLNLKNWMCSWTATFSSMDFCPPNTHPYDLDEMQKHMHCLYGIFRGSFRASWAELFWQSLVLTFHHYSPFPQSVKAFRRNPQCDVSSVYSHEARCSSHLQRNSQRLAPAQESFSYSFQAKQRPNYTGRGENENRSHWRISSVFVI